CGALDGDRDMFDSISAAVPKEVPVMIFNSDGADEQTVSKSRHNSELTNGAVHLATYLRYHFPSATIVLTCYYALQAKILCRLTRQLNVLSVTVDKFVGKESDFVIVCLSRCVPAGEEINPLRYSSVLNRNRATVAQSRGRHGVFVMGQVRLLK
ncbi:hypothetical protein AAVH_19878, partial [Aphelenchoides avenae]